MIKFDIDKRCSFALFMLWSLIILINRVSMDPELKVN